MSKENDIFNEIKIFNGKIENDQFDHKESLHAGRLIRHILGFLNGFQKYGYIIIGFEDNNSQFDLRKHKLISNRNTITAFESELFDLIRRHVFPSTNNNRLQEPLVDVVPIMLNAGNRVGYIVVIKIRQSPLRPHAYLRDTNNHISPNPRYYIRRNRGSGRDGCTGTMSPEELAQQMVANYFRSHPPLQSRILHQPPARQYHDITIANHQQDRTHTSAQTAQQRFNTMPANTSNEPYSSTQRRNEIQSSTFNSTLVIGTAVVSAFALYTLFSQRKATPKEVVLASTSNPKSGWCNIM